MPARFVRRDWMTRVGQLGEVAVAAPWISEAGMSLVSAVEEIDQHVSKTPDLSAVVAIGVEPLAGGEKGATDHGAVAGRLQTEALEVREVVAAGPQIEQPLLVDECQVQGGIEARGQVREGK